MATSGGGSGAAGVGLGVDGLGGVVQVSRRAARFGLASNGADAGRRAVDHGRLFHEGLISRPGVLSRGGLWAYAQGGRLVGTHVVGLGAVEHAWLRRCAVGILLWAERCRLHVAVGLAHGGGPKGQLIVGASR